MPPGLTSHWSQPNLLASPIMYGSQCMLQWENKHLGVELSTNFSWKDHITTISENAGKKLNILAKLKNLIGKL